MPPKKGGKKGKKNDDDFWDTAGESVPSTTAADVADVEDRPEPKSKSSFSGFAALNMDNGEAAQEEEADEDFGGLMSTLTATKGKKEKKKPKKSAVVQDPSDDEGGESAPAPSQSAVEVTAEDLADEEWGPVKEKKKGKKGGKGKKGKAEVDEDEEPVGPVPDVPAGDELTPAPAAPADTPEDDDADELEEAGTKPLSKKEKEKLKKEREKAKKKAQAAAKKAADGDAPAPTPAPAATESAAAEEPADDAEEGEGEAAGSSKNKKKKKKATKKDDEPAPVAAPKKGGKISALKAMMDEKRRIEEEARKIEEEARRKFEEEERRIEEEEQKKEEEKARRKEKEKAKKEIAKKEGRLLTKKQKEDKATAERRRDALLASGVKIDGLQAPPAGGAPAAKKVVYGNKKKKGPAVKEVSASPSPVPEVHALSPEAPQEDAADEADNWDVSSADEAPVVPEPEGDDVKDDWDASSGDEEKPEPVKPAAAAPPPASKSVDKKAKSTPSAPKATPASSKAAPTKAVPAAKGKAPVAAVEESSEEESEGDDDDSSDGSGSGSDSDDSDDDSDDSSSDEELTATQRMVAQKKADAAERRKATREAALAAGNKDDLRSPICCILGHVDTGKTKLLDKIRQTNVQEGEAGGITQQIGATYFPVDAIITKTLVLNRDGKQEYKVPGLLVIDTPGHESFTNLRSRGSSLCNIAVLVVDIMHGLEPQTLESLKLLRDRKTPFIVALNKIDRMYGWQATPDGAFQESLAKQNVAVQREFADRVEKTILAFAEQGLNSVLYYNNKNLGKNVSLVPTSAITGEGVPDMIMLLVNLTQQRMSDRLMYLSELECTVLEVKVIEGLGTTIDVVLSNGILREGDKIVVCGLNGPIVTTIRALLTPEPLRELRIKSAYVHHKEVKAALGVKITAPDLEKAIAGSRLLVCGPDDDEDDLREEIMSDLTSLLNSIDKSGRGVCVQASTLGSLEALLEFLRTSKIPVSGINIGPVHKKDIMRAATMLEKAKELAVILCFDVTVDKDAERMADEMGVRLFKADIIYHLFDAFTAYNAEIVEAKRKDAAPSAVWPCRLKIIAAFCKREPIILGVDIIDGTLRVGTPLAVVKVDPVTGKKDIIDLGKITSLEINHKTYDIVKKSQAGAGVAVKIEHAVYQSAKMFGRHFDDKDELLSHVTRQSIDVLKNSFKKDVPNEEWLLIKALKPKFNIQ